MRNTSVTGRKSESGPPTRSIWERTNREILQELVRLTEHDTGSTARLHAERIQAQLKRYARAHGDTPALISVVTDALLWGRVLKCDRSLVKDRQISRGALVGIRDAFAALTAALPPPPGTTRDELRRNLQTAREQSTEQRGLRRVLKVGRAPSRDRRPVPTVAEIELTIAAIRKLPHQLADCCADLVGFCYLTAVRIGAALALTGAAVEVMPDGRCWVYVHEKARADRRPVLVRTQRRELQLRWRNAALDEPLWSEGDKQLSKAQAARLLRLGCERAGVTPFTFHRLRGSFATDVEAILGLGVTMQAVGWLAETVAEGYIHRRAGELR